MQEKKSGVKRLLRSIENNIVTDSELSALSALLNYDKQQLREDIEAIQLVTVLNSDEMQSGAETLLTRSELELLRLSCVSAKYDARHNSDDDSEIKYSNLQNKIAEIQERSGF